MPIDHVVVLCLENRSFDHMLGFLEHPDASFEGLNGPGPHENPGYGGGPSVAASPKAKAVLPFGPDHSHDAVMRQLGVSGRGASRRCANDGFVTSYELKAAGRASATVAGFLAPLINRLLRRKRAAAAKSDGRGPLVMLCQDPKRIPVLRTLALQFAVFDHWFCSVPGETWPNRNYLHAATSDDETDIEIRLYTDPTIFELLEKHGSSWHIYHDDTPQVWAFRNLWDTPERHANWYPFNRFAEHAAAGTLPTYSFIEPNHRPPLHTPDRDPRLGGTPGVSNSQHPENNLVPDADYDHYTDGANSDFERGEQLIATIYESLRANPDLFARTLFLVTYDEHGGLYDHVAPPTNVPAPGDRRGFLAHVLHAIWHRKVKPFDFTMLGPRVPTVLVSPLIDPGTLIHDIHDHASVPSTLRELFAADAEPLTHRDAWAPSFGRTAGRETPRTDLPDLSAHVPVQPPASAAAAGAQPTPATPAAIAALAPANAQTPDYFDAFIKQADEVRKHLEDVHEPEIAGTGGSASDVQRALQTTAAFAAAAHRHRHPGQH